MSSHWACAVFSTERPSMSLTIILLLFGALLFGMPVAYVLGVTSVFMILQTGGSSLFPLIPMRFFNSINLFPLMAMPLFILAGEIMNRAGITSRIIDFSTRLVGHWRGGWLMPTSLPLSSLPASPDRQLPTQPPWAAC